MLSCELICKSLQSLDRRERQRALNDLIDFANDSETSGADIIRVYDETYLYILKCYSDKYESCRELAVNVVSEFIRKLPKNDYYLQYAISVLAGRIGKKEIIEDSEELRLLLLMQLDVLIEKYSTEENGCDFLLKSYDEIVDVLIKELKDNYPSAQRAACAAIKNLAGATPSFHYRAEALVEPLIPLLRHKHSMNRISAVETLAIISLHIRTNSDCISQIITEISPLLMDSMPLVRKECGKAGCRMLLELRDRYSFFARILPLVLCCLNDDTPDVRDCIQRQWLKCGEQYYEENENELAKKEIADDMPSRYPDDVKRPSIGCRAIVQRSLKIIPLVLREIADWKEEVRLHSLKLLWQIILHSEIMIAVHILDIFPVLSRACADTEKYVVTQAIKCAELMGMLMIYKEWFGSCLEVLEEHPKLGVLKCFYHIFSAAACCSVTEDVQTLAKLLHKRDFCHSFNPHFQLYLLKFVDILSECRDTQKTISEAMENLSIAEGDEETEKYMYHVAIKVMALSYNESDKTLSTFGSQVLAKLAQDECLVPTLHAKHLGSVLSTIDCLDADNDGNTEPILLLHGVICTCGFQEVYLDQIKRLLMLVWEHGTSDAQVKILSAVSIAMLNWQKTINTSKDKSRLLLRDFVKEVVVFHLEWKPGASAEGLRSLATATLCSMAEGAPEDAPGILSELAAGLSDLVEDHSVRTRVYALRSLSSIGPVKIEDFRSLGFAVIQRLDDPSSEVRNLAAQAIKHIRVDDSTIDDNGRLSIRNFYADIFSTMFLHFEGPEIKLRENIKDSMIAIGSMQTDVFEEASQKAYAVAGKTTKEEIENIKLLIKSRIIA